jgi:gluconate 2-dehydrogenase gamma chain
MGEDNLSRRGFLTVGAVVGAAAAGAPLGTEARTIKGEMPWAPGAADPPAPAQPGPYLFFTPAEAAFVEAAVERLIPTDELGPGGRDAGCAVFIDRQLAGPYGRAQRWYMQGPWGDGTKTQGYQSRLAPAELYRAAIGGVDEWCRQKLGGKSFAALDAARQDEVLAELENATVTLENVDVGQFFNLLLHNTVEGYFADPLYGGNKDMAGWRMIGFPGARYDHRDFVAKHGQPYKLPPVSLHGRPGWNRREG